MDVTVVAGQLCDPLGDVAACRAELAAVRTVRGMLDAREAMVVARLHVLAEESPGLFPEDVVASENRIGLGQASRLSDRARARGSFPKIAEAMQRGDTTGGHLDTVVNATRGLTSEQKERVAAHDERLAVAAACQSKNQFEVTVRRIVNAVCADDGLATLARQKRASRLKFGLNRESGMWWFRGELDPEAGAQVEARLRATVDGMFHDSIPDTCPTDPLARQDHLAALALVALIAGTAPQGQAADVTVIVDWETLSGGFHEHSVYDIGLSRFGLPIDTIRRWVCCSDITPVVVAPGGQRILLGRTIRNANRSQRRALRVLYRTCALCDIAFEHCQVHHVTWYTTGNGNTDIDNLVPLCSRHHHLAHEGGWQLALTSDRTLTVTRPDNTIHSHAPPTAKAA